ncbi:hypothetical protein [Legionella waltersii]|uniref:Substrate of the Dot/Icm secretion system n=1 Tax=Legionella waltersii TaxID=66969 RepID=A0A0W1AM60_9GAMM|nr:hypothetical protein [Legionella waltersii]KTD82404.1 substrate of the Dot/Icm secretion system [Legionella waltersii]SNV03501.1 Dot/Icm secretion system substrate [Legionella waltersii]
MRAKQVSNKNIKKDDDTKKMATGIDSAAEFIELIVPTKLPIPKEKEERELQIQFLPKRVESSENQVSITFPLLIQQRDKSIKKQRKLTLFPESIQYSQYSAFLQLIYTREDDRAYFYLKCQSIINVFNYDLSKLLAILNDSITASKGQVINQVEVIDEESKASARKTVVHGPRDLDKLLKDVFDFNINCLKRFEELVEHQDKEAYENSKALGLLLDKIFSDYKRVDIKEYQSAFARVLKVLEHEDFKYDPQIALSITPIRQALGILSESKNCRNQGVQVTARQIELVLEELRKHEDKTPGANSWLSPGSVDEFFTLIDDLSSTYLDNPSISV